MKYISRDKFLKRIENKFFLLIFKYCSTKKCCGVTSVLLPLFIIGDTTSVLFSLASTPVMLHRNQLFLIHCQISTLRNKPVFLLAGFVGKNFLANSLSRPTPYK